jgi:hypothetical protein
MIFAVMMFFRSTSVTGKKTVTQVKTTKPEAADPKKKKKKD